MAHPKNEKERDSRENYEVDVDRMINEGMAGGTVNSRYNHAQIEEARELPKQNEAFSNKTQHQKH
ncbi:hypothetical protein IMZ31_03760 [Pontibacillus sp. ALD_SL1]|uniref:hypothetical protein n=1 Tax=Pontibacillus sp. ALD_SL1 TaxID=2777185 RepID=UPI001A959DA8|nr:hypothetical protein [Pontibacillus sp. ALD_SL1]QST00700.1 hypothetical protein IMZ31_03760 [Pontibacillus sp. ALD_SL1]